MSRPDRNYSEQVVLRISPELRDAITRAALDEDRTLASMTRRLLQRAVSDYQHEQAPA
jgi:predicted HicB family RNase H-like nuclease